MPDRSSVPIMELREASLAASVGSAYLLQDVSFSVDRGDKLAIIGATGSGKTTLLRLLNRLSTPTTGTIYLEEKPLSQIPIIQLRQQIVLVPQEPKLLGMSVRETLAYPMTLQKLPPKERGRDSGRAPFVSGSTRYLSSVSVMALR